jgi:hypothetical protein
MGWKNWPEINTLAFYKNSYNTDKTLYFWALGPMLNFFTIVIYGFSKKARVFVLGKHFQLSLMLVGKARGLP